MELAEILARPKFDPYERIPITHVVRACRDPKDDKFLELAVNGAAQLIITGDADLPALHLFRGIDILAPAHYLAPLTGQGADISVIDDPLKPEEALSQTQRQAVNEWAAIARPRAAPRSGAGPPPVVARNLRGVRFNAAYPDRIRAVLACRRCGTS
jgi:PIN domain